MNDYSDPLDQSISVAHPPLWPNLLTGDLQLPSVEEIIFRLIAGWQVLRIKSLCGLSGYGPRTIEKILPGLVEKGWIKPLGRPTRGRFSGVNQELYTIGPTPPTGDFLDFRPRALRTRPLNPQNLHNESGVPTSHDLLLPAHPVYVAEAATWIAQALAKGGNPCLPVPERILRQVYGWYSPKKEQEKKFFLTPIPDAWLIFNGRSFRLEVQISTTSADNVRVVCAGSPLGEPVLYVVTEDYLYERFSPLLEEYPFFFLVRFQNATDLTQAHSRFRDLVAKGGLQRWWMRDYYSGDAFAYAYLKAETGWKFCQNYPRPAA
jgi:hypothetical protein